MCMVWAKKSPKRSLRTGPSIFDYPSLEQLGNVT